MTEALEAAEKFGYEVGKINASQTDNEILWDSKNDLFCYLDGTTIKYIPESVLEVPTDNLKKVDYWVIRSVTDRAQKGEARTQISAIYSTYLKEITGDASIIIDKGLDVGKTNVLTSITYENKGENAVAQEVVIRTNSNLTTLTVNAPKDLVRHYDTVGIVNVISCETASYHENGIVSFLEVAGGHIVLEETSKVSAVHFTATNGAFKNSDNKTISIDLSKLSKENMPSFTRDTVTIGTNGTFVAEVITDKAEFVWLFGNGIKEQMVVTTQEGAIAENGTLKSGITPGAKAGSVAEQIANPAKRNSEGALVDDNEDEIDVSAVNWSNSDALESVTSIVYGDLKTKQDAINETVSTLIMNMAQLHDYITGSVVNGVIGADIEVTEIMELGGDKVMNLNGFTLNVNLSSGRPFVFSNNQSMTVNANDGGMNITNNNTNGLFRIQSPGVKLVLNGGTYTGYTPDASAIIWVGNNGSSLTFAVEIELNNVTANCIGQFIRDGSQSGHPAYESYNLPTNKYTIKGGNYTFNNGGINVNGSITGFNLMFTDTVFDGVTATSAIGAITELDGGSVLFKNNNFEVLNSNNIQSWNATTIGVAYEADVTIESGTYSGYYGVSIFSSGGNLVINGGTITGSSGTCLDLYANTSQYSFGNTSTCVINGGTLSGETTCHGTVEVTDNR